MHIIENGHYPEKNKIKCPKCLCYFEYYDSEIHTEMTDPDIEAFLGGFGIWKYINCPQCNEEVTISSKFIEQESFKLIKKWFNKIFKKEKGKDEDGKIKSK